MATVLLVDDEAPMRRAVARQLDSLGHTAVQAADARQALELVDTRSFDVVLTDVRMPGTDGIGLCEALQLQLTDVPVVVMTGFGTLDMAIAAMRVGAWDFLRKPFPTEALGLSLHRALEHRRVRQELRLLRRVTESERGPGGLVGQSPSMRTLFERIERVGPTNVTVLVLGPSGVGKERVARSVHLQSPRKNAPFVAINCGAIPEALVESELFGHVAGAYTGAERPRPGVFRAAHGGTLFLDEVGELSLPAQARLLRVLEERKVRPVGQDTEESVDVRVIAATNVDLAAAIRDGRFREDLFYRLGVLTLTVPRLQDRPEDILLLASEVLDEQAQALGRPLELDDAFEAALLQWPWPGNVRELKNTLEAASVLSADGVLRFEHLPARMQGAATGGVPPAAPEGFPSLDEIERRHILRVLRATDGNRSRAARILGIDRKTLLTRLRRYDIQST